MGGLFFPKPHLLDPTENVEASQYDISCTKPRIAVLAKNIRFFERRHKRRFKETLDLCHSRLFYPVRVRRRIDVFLDEQRAIEPHLPVYISAGMEQQANGRKGVEELYR